MYKQYLVSGLSCPYFFLTNAREQQSGLQMGRGALRNLAVVVLKHIHNYPNLLSGVKRSV